MVPSQVRQPIALLDSVSPYGSRRVTVEYDGVTTAAYLHDESSPISATWIANHLPAPNSVDPARLEAGHAPLMPAARTRLPGGRPPLDASLLEALWFEEGDGAAILENGRPLAVIPGWSDMDRGMPGYSRDIIGQTPFGWSLTDALEGLAPRLERARSYWRWRQSADGWGRAPAAQARAGRTLLGGLGRAPASGRNIRTTRRATPSVHGLVHRRHELPADAGGGAGA
jgi:hypothetical protein